jgi:hypothetical protein
VAETLAAAGIILVAMVALALPVLQVRRDLRGLQDHLERLASQVALVRQEVQALQELLGRLGRLEALVTGTAGLTLLDIQAQATTPDRGTARGDRKEESK